MDKPLDTWICMSAYSIILATDALVLKHQTISIYGVDYIIFVLDQLHT